MGTKICKVCGRELPHTSFRATRWGHSASTCNECITSALHETKAHRRVQPAGTSFSDPDFDGKDPGDVWRQMCRAKKWLESRGCRITLHGDFIETKTRKLKFE